MAEQNGFRKSFRGFNRQDVMDYMDGIQADFSEREAGLREGLTQANADLTSLTEENKKLKAAAETAEQKREELRLQAYNRFEQMNAQIIALRRENEQLRAAAASGATSSAAPAINASPEEAASLLGAINELRARGADFLAASGNAGAECLDEMDGLISELEASLRQMRSKVGDARADLNARRDAAGLRLSELESSLKGEAPLTVRPQPTAKPAAQRAVLRIHPQNGRK